MNIALINNLFPPINTGSSFYTSDVADNLIKSGHNVTVITNAIDKKSLYEVKGNLKIYRLPIIKLPRLKIWMGFPHFNYSLTYSNSRLFKIILISNNIEVINSLIY